MNVHVPELSGKNGTAFMEGLERWIRLSSEQDVHDYAAREESARREKMQMGKHKVEGLGQLKAVIPLRDYLRWSQQEGPDVWGDATFRKEFYRDNPDLVVQ